MWLKMYKGLQSLPSFEACTATCCGNSGSNGLARVDAVVDTGTAIRGASDRQTSLPGPSCQSAVQLR